jgi:hypothetical protein
MFRKSAESLEGIQAVRFGVGGESSWTEQPGNFQWGQRPTQSPFDPTKVKLPLEALIYRQARDRVLAEARQKYDREQESRLAEYDVRVDAEIQRFLSFLAQTPKVEPPCTRFEDLTTRIHDQNRSLNLIITDAVVDCRDAPRSGVKLRPMTGRVAILLVPRRNEQNGVSESARFSAREAKIKRFFPEAEIFRPYELDRLSDFLKGIDSTSESSALVRGSESATTPRSAIAQPIQLTPLPVSGTPRYETSAEPRQDPTTPRYGPGLKIISLRNGAIVPQQIEIEVAGAKPEMELRAVVHPIGRGDQSYWIQDAGDVRAGATALAPAVIGREGSQDCGVRYQIRVFQVPAGTLTTGPAARWPHSDTSSLGVTVIRGSDCEGGGDVGSLY